MGELEGRVAVITGAGTGIGREHALLFASEGASVVVNDLGVEPDGSGRNASLAESVAAEIRSAGGKAISNSNDVTNANGAQQMISQAIETFGDLHILVNNAGILRDRMLVNLTDQEWDDVIRVHLRGHFLTMRASAQHWRAQAKAGHNVQASIINTTSTSGLFNNIGQTNYGSAKTAIATLSIIAQEELGRYGVRVNAIAPAARTRLNAGLHPDEVVVPDDYLAANISPFVAYLATADCPIAGRVFYVRGYEVHLLRPFSTADSLIGHRRWTIQELQKSAAHFADFDLEINRPY